MKRSDRGSGHFFSFVFQQQGVYLALHGEHALHIGVHLLQQRLRRLVVHAGAAGGAELAGHRHHPGPDPRRRQALAGQQGGQMGVERGDIAAHLDRDRRKS